MTTFFVYINYMAPRPVKAYEHCNDQLMSSLSETESAMIAQTNNLLPEFKEELSFTVKQAYTNIYARKAHTVRS